LDSISTKPVQNKVINEAINAIKELIVGDLEENKDKTLDELLETSNKSSIVGAINSVKNSIPSTESLASKDYVDTQLSDLIGNDSVETQITNALADGSTKAITKDEINAICGTTLEFDDLLTDETTNTAYKLYVSEGKLKMTEVSE
jgi:hypothetical protein